VRHGGIFAGIQLLSAHEPIIEEERANALRGGLQEAWSMAAIPSIAVPIALAASKLLMFRRKKTKLAAPPPPPPPEPSLTSNGDVADGPNLLDELV
jgi:hypothetical protein